MCEVLNTTPGSIYSTAILFHSKGSQSCSTDEINPDGISDEENIGDETLSDEDSDEQGDDMRDFGNQG